MDRLDYLLLALLFIGALLMFVSGIVSAHYSWKAAALDQQSERESAYLSEFGS